MVPAADELKSVRSGEPVATFHEIFHGTRIVTAKLPE